MPQVQTSKNTGCDQGTVSRVLSRYMTHRTVDRLPGGGNKKRTDDRADRRIKMLVDGDKDMKVDK